LQTDLRQNSKADMRVLQLCHKPPFPPVDGGCVAMNAITSGLLANGHEVKVLTVFTDKHDFIKEKIPAAYSAKTAIEAIYINTNLKVYKGFVNLFSDGSYNIERFYSKDFDAKLQEVLQKNKYDVVQFESLFVAPYFDTVKKYTQAKIVLRAHNVEHLIWERLSAQAGNPVKKYYLRFLSKRMKKYELHVINEFNGIAAITGVDKDYFIANGCKKPIEVFPLGIDASQYKHAQQRQVDFPSLFHLGSMDWQPNEEGIKWFLEKAWFGIHAKFPELKLYLAGRNMPDWLETLEMEGVVIAGAVENAHDFMREKAIMVVPLLSGGGMRVKIIEGMALGKAIISTTIGAEGIDYTHEENILIADTPEQFLLQIEKCLNDRSYYNRLCVNANKHALANYDYKEIAKKLNNFYKQL